eukprot:XP_011677455.1 PREDICTED: uncharacterized protein LOC100889691 [Strongylocentrotus purpuratus]
MATPKHQERCNSSCNSDRSNNEGKWKVSVRGPPPSFQVEFTLNPLNQFSDQRGIKIEIMLDVKQGDKSEMLPVSVQPTDEDGNSGAEQDTAPETGSDHGPDEAMTEIGSLRSDEGCD